jgi:hypothetical protein
LLGARVVASHNGNDLGFTEINRLGRLAEELANSDWTLEDPTVLASKGGPEISSLLQRLGTIIIRSNRDLAKRIFEGFRVATE